MKKRRRIVPAVYNHRPTALRPYHGGQGFPGSQGSISRAHHRHAQDVLTRGAEHPGIHPADVGLRLCPSTRPIPIGPDAVVLLFLGGSRVILLLKSTKIILKSKQKVLYLFHP